MQSLLPLTRLLDVCVVFLHSVFFFNDTAPTEIYTLSLHDALPTWGSSSVVGTDPVWPPPSPPCTSTASTPRSEEHTSELQSHSDLVCRLLLEKKKKHHQATRACQQAHTAASSDDAPHYRVRHGDQR